MTAQSSELSASCLGSPPSMSGWIGHIALALLVLVVFGQTVTFDFVDYDDPGYVFKRQRIHDGLTLENIGWAFTTISKANYHPLTWLSYLADVSVFGMEPGGFHFTNLLLHLVNTLFLFELLSRLTGDRWRSFLVSALFGVHPLHVESVAWISERKDVLSTLFCLAAIAAYARWTRVRKVSTWIWVMVWMLLSLLAKQTMVTLPCVLMLLDVWPLRRTNLTFLQSLREKWSLFLMSVVFSIAVVNAQVQSDAVIATDSITMSIRLGNAILSYATYLRRVFWPLDLAFFYPHPRTSLDWQLVALSAAILLATTVVCWIFRKPNPALLTGWLWYLGTLLPMIGIVQVGAQALADRYTYVPLIGLFIALAWSIPDAWLTQAAPRRMLFVACGMALALSTFQACRQTATWRDTYSMTEHALRLNPNNDIAHSQLGGAFLADGNIAKAEVHFRRAIEINPTKRLECYSNLGVILLDRGEPEAAARQFRQALAYDDAYLWARRGLISALLVLGELNEAERELVTSLELFPKSAAIWYLQGQWHLLKGDVASARSAFERSLAIDPTYEKPREELRWLAADSATT
jgi:tetratricopeptide (TPR) repeat protein